MVIVKSKFWTDLSFGQVLVFSGKTFTFANTIYFDFFTPDKVVLRIFFDFEKHHIERKIGNGKDWTKVEIKENMEPSPAAVPKPGEFFKIAFFCDEDRYRIWLQDKPYCHYSYFIPITEIKELEIGSTSLKKVTQFDHRRLFPSPWPLIQYDEPNLKFSYEIPTPIERNQMMIIQGKVQDDEKGNFTVYFRHGARGEDQLSFKVCFDKKKIFRTNMKDPCSFVPDETSGPFPFQFGEFKLAIGFLKDRFIFGVNGERIPDYKYVDNTTFGNLTSFKIRSSEKLDVIISSIQHNELTNEDCIDFDLKDISCEKPVKKLRAKSGDTGDGDSSLEDDEDCIDSDHEIDYPTSSSGSIPIRSRRLTYR